MKLSSILMGLAVLLPSTPLYAATVYDANVTPGVIFGSGNANGSYTVETASGVEIGLRGKLRHNAMGVAENTFNSNGDGSYTFTKGEAPTQAYPTAVWSFEWSINTNYDNSSSWNLDDLTYELNLDTDPGVGSTSFFTFDPINDINPGNGEIWWDHSMGNNTTTSATDSIATSAVNYAALIGGNNVAQNSWKAHWYIPGFNPNTTGEYTISLSAFDGDTLIATSLIDINVVPEPSTIALVAVGMVGLVAAYRRRRRNK
jgi:hypothetical protein